MGDAAIKFTETRVGGIARKELLKYIQEEECMGKSDEEEYENWPADVYAK